MNQSVLVSVIIPCHNAARWIAETIESCLVQTYRPLEIIVIDDGSTDKSADLAEAILQSSKVSFQVHRIVNSGPSKARNIGFKHASGEWIQFLDADDLIKPEKLEHQIRMATALSEDHAVVYTEWQRIAYHPQQKVWLPIGEMITPQLHEPVIDLLRSENFIHTGSQIFRRSWLEKVGGFDESMWLIEDVNLLLRIAMAGGKFAFAIDGRPLFMYRQHPSSLSRRDPIAFARSCLKNASLVEEWLRTRSPITTYQRDVLTEAYGFIARTSFDMDAQIFDEAHTALSQLWKPKTYVPSNPRHLSVASQLLGYREAEHIASYYRRLKQLISRQFIDKSRNSES